LLTTAWMELIFTTHLVLSVLWCWWLGFSSDNQPTKHLMAKHLSRDASMDPAQYVAYCFSLTFMSVISQKNWKFGSWHI